MKKIVLTFGILSGLVTSGTMLTMLLVTRGSNEMFEHGELVGYGSMIIAFVLVFFGIRAYRDQNGGSITFGRAFKVGILATLVSSAMYVGTWEAYYFTVGGDFMNKYTAYTLEKARASGASATELAAQKAQLEQMAKLYRNPFFHVGFTFLEIFPVGLVMTLASAAILSRKRAVEELRTATT